MILTPYASSSKGNLYTLQSGDTSLLLECGLPIKEIRKHLNFGLSKMNGCLLTHSHKDHSLATRDILKAGVDLYISQGTAEACGLADHHRLHIIKDGKAFKVGGLTILPFATQHDAPESLGWLITNGTDTMCFATDTGYLKWRFANLTLIAIECNYCDDMIEDLESYRKDRLVHTHMSLETVKDMLRANDLSMVKEIHLLHLSDDHADASRCKREIQQLTGLPVYIAKE